MSKQRMIEKKLTKCDQKSQMRQKKAQHKNLKRKAKVYLIHGAS